MKRACIRFLLGLVLVVTGLAIGMPVATLRAQDRVPEPLPTFEVASIRENGSGDSRAPMRTLPGGRFVATNALLKLLIADGFLGDQPLAVSRVLGGPEWIGSTRYDVTAKASTEFQLSPDGPPRDLLLMLDPNGPTLFTALQEQLGLKLESAKGPVDVVVVDSVERPTPE